MNSNYKKFLPYAAAVVIFAVLTLIYFRPLLSGKQLRQDDISRHRAMSKEIFDYREKHNAEPLWTNSMFGGMPAFQISTLYPGNWLGGTVDRAMKLFLPHPGGYLFLYFAGFYILLLCLRIDPWVAFAGALAYGLSSYFLIIIEAGHNSKANALGYLPPLLGGVILLFSGRKWLGFALATFYTAMEINANHVQITYYGYMLIGFVMAGYAVAAFRAKELRNFAAGLGLFMLATILGLLPNAGLLLTTFEYTKYTTRGPSELTIKSTLRKTAMDGAGTDQLLEEKTRERYERNNTTGLSTSYATQWSYGIGETFTFLIPDFKGGATSSIQQADPKALKKVNPQFREEVAGSNAYFGDQPFTSGPVYIGAIVVFLSFLALLLVRHPVKWPVCIATLLTVMLGWGSNFMPLTEFFMHHVPGYNKFRAVSMIMVVAELTLPLLAALALHELLKYRSWNDKVQVLKRQMPLKKAIMIALGVVGGFCLLCYLAPGVVNDFSAQKEETEIVSQYVQAGYPEEQVRPHVAQLMPELEKAREAIFRSDALRSTIFVLLAFVALYLYYTGKANGMLMTGSLALFIVIDLWTVDRRYLNDQSFITKEQNTQSIIRKTQADEEILRDTTLHYRVMNLSQGRWQDAMTSYYHKSVGGYHGAKLRKFQELIDFHLDTEIVHFYRDAERMLGSDSGRRQLLSQMQLLNMLNTRYLILPGGEGVGELPLLNEQANGNAWFVKDLRVVPDADEEILALDRINTKTEALVRQNYVRESGLKQHYSAEGTIRLTSYAPDRLTYSYQSPEPQFAVFSEIYYPAGWNAYVDGQLTPHIGVNYVLRGMQLPAGNHTLEFRFEPRTYSVGNNIAIAGSLLVLTATALGFFLDRRNRVIVS